jgi:hypothetical protein
VVSWAWTRPALAISAKATVPADRLFNMIPPG